MRCGIYCIWNTLSNKVYIGSSLRLEQRKIEHFRDLKNNTHFNSHLQHSFNKHGIDNFKWLILEITSNSKNLEKIENKWIHHFQSFNDKYGYNMQDVKRNVCRPETSEKLRANAKALWANPNFVFNTLEGRRAQAEKMRDAWKKEGALKESVEEKRKLKKRKSMSITIKNKHNDPEFKKCFLKVHQGGEIRNKISKRAIDRWANPIFKSKMENIQQSPDYIKKQRTSYSFSELRKENAKKATTTKEYRDGMSKIKIQMWKDPEMRTKILKAKNTLECKEKVSKKVKLHHKNPIYRKEQSDMQKQLWNDPLYKKKVIDSRKKLYAKQLFCGFCGASFIKTAPQQIFCSSKCSRRMYKKRKRLEKLINRIDSLN